MKIVTQLFKRFFILLLTSSISFYIFSCTGGTSGLPSTAQDSGVASTTVASAQPPPPQSTSTHAPEGNARRVMIELSLGPDHRELECDENQLPQASILTKEENSDWQLSAKLENNISPNPDENTHFCQKFMSSLGYFQNKPSCDNSLLKFKVQFKNNGLYEGESRNISCEEREIKEGLSLSIELFPVRPDIPTLKKENEKNPHIFQKPPLLPPAAKK